MTCSHPPGPASAREDPELIAAGGAVREFKAEFETSTFVVSEASTTLRPDAVSFDHKKAFSYGPIAEGNTSAGVETWVWRARADNDNIYLSRYNGGWETETILWPNYQPGGVPIVELSLAFTESARPVVVFELANGDIWFVWYNPNAGPTYQQTQIGPGKTPRVVLDLFPTATGHCGPAAYVQLLYLHPTNGMVKREQSDGFVAELVTTITSSLNKFLESFFPTAGRRLSVSYSERNVSEGTYALKRQDTLAYAEDLLKRPSLPAQFFSLVWFQSELWFSPSGSPITENFQLRVDVLDNVSGIQFVAADTSGNFAESNWTVQAYDTIVDFPSGFSAGGGTSRDFSVSHGANTMTPRAFRARTYRTVSGSPCYSQWEYFFAARGSASMTVNDLGTDTTLHRQTFQVTSPNAQIYAIFIEAGGTYPNFTEGFYASGTTFVCQQVLDVNSIWRTPYSFSPRNKDPIAFTDVGGNVFAFDLTSKEHTNTQGTAPIFPPAPAIGFNQNPITFPFVPPGFGLGVSFPGWEAENVTAAEQPVSRPLPLAHEAKYYDPVLFSGIDVEIPFLTDTFDGASITVLATLQTLEARLTQTDVFGVALLDRLETSMIVRTIEGCPTALPRFPDDTPAIPTFENMEVCCHE